MCGDVSEGGEEGGVKGTGVVEERAGGTLDVQFFSGGCGGGVRGGGHLGFGRSIGGGDVNGRGFKLANALGASLVEEAGNVGGYGEGHGAVRFVVVSGIALVRVHRSARTGFDFIFGG